MSFECEIREPADNADRQLCDSENPPLQCPTSREQGTVILDCKQLREDDRKRDLNGKPSLVQKTDFSKNCWAPEALRQTILDPNNKWIKDARNVEGVKGGIQGKIAPNDRMPLEFEPFKTNNRDNKITFKTKDGKTIAGLLEELGKKYAKDAVACEPKVSIVLDKEKWDATFDIKIPPDRNIWDDSRSLKDLLYLYFVARGEKDTYDQLADRFNDPNPQPLTEEEYRGVGDSLYVPTDEELTAYVLKLAVKRDQLPLAIRAAQQSDSLDTSQKNQLVELCEYFKAGGNEHLTYEETKSLVGLGYRPVNISSLYDPHLLHITDENIKYLVEDWLEHYPARHPNPATGAAVHISNWDVSQVTDMSFLFEDAKTFNQDISRWNVENVTNMRGMFYNAVMFNQPIGEWGEKVGKVTDMSKMFYGARAFNHDISNWNVENVMTMSGMFNKAVKFNQPIGEWREKVGNVTNMFEMFYEASEFNQELNEWKVDNVTHMSHMFADATRFNKKLGKWNVGKVTDMSSMFVNAIRFNQELENWDVGKVADMSRMFYGAKKFNGDLNGWGKKTHLVRSMYAMFSEAEEFNKPLNTWDVGNVRNFVLMFYGAFRFNQPLEGWKLKIVPCDRDLNGNVTDTKISMTTMFANAEDFNQNLNEWQVDRVQSMNSMFLNAKSFNQPLCKWKVNNVCDMGKMFFGATNFNQDLTKWQIDNVHNVFKMFAGATSFVQTNLFEGIPLRYLQ